MPPEKVGGVMLPDRPHMLPPFGTCTDPDEVPNAYTPEHESASHRVNASGIGHPSITRSSQPSPRHQQSTIPLNRQMFSTSTRQELDTMTSNSPPTTFTSPYSTVSSVYSNPASAIQSTHDEALEQQAPLSAPNKESLTMMSATSLRPQQPRQPEFRLRFLQQPVAARACGHGLKDRRTIDPPPILSLDAIHSTLLPGEIRQFLSRNPGVVHCEIVHADSGSDASRAGGPDDRRHTRRLIGTLVSNIWHPEDTTVLPPMIACFADLSVRTPGRFRLKFRVMFVGAPVPGTKLPAMASVLSDIFEVYSPKEFPGMQASTPLVHEIRNQGLSLPIKKGQSPEA